MEGNNNNYKNKNYYKYHHNHNNKFYYKNNKKQNRYFYHHKKHNNKENQVISEQNNNDKNILLSELQQDIEDKILNSEELNNQEQSIDSNDQVLENENINNNNLVQAAVNNIVQENDYEELEFVPVKKSDSKRSYGKKFTFKHAIAIFIIIAVLFGVTYSYFTFTKVDSRQADITSGDVYVKILENSVNLTLNKMYPRTNEEARARDDNYIDFTVKAKNTSATKEVAYTISITNGEDVQGKTRINPQYLVVDLQEKVNNEYVYVKNAVTLSSFDFSGVVPINTTSEITKEYRLRIWVSDTITISDTETGASYTQAQFANLYANIHVDVNSEDRTYVPSPICKRVTSAANLHTETCTNTRADGYCQADGYELNETITYGNAKTNGQSLLVGDAFDCNVDGTGYNQRFYYLSSYYDTNTMTFDSNTAVLVYYSNTVYDNTTNSVIASENVAAYASIDDTQALNYTCNEEYGCNWYGPVTAVKHLPTTTQWSNVTLKSTSRTILACEDLNCSTTPVETVRAYESVSWDHTIENPFSYSGKAARLLTQMEIKQSGCAALSGKTNVYGESGALSACNFLFEGTRYVDLNKATLGVWLENPYALSTDYEMIIAPFQRWINAGTSEDNAWGVRPAIDVPYSRLEY